jgi:hypothetical protein
MLGRLDAMILSASVLSALASVEDRQRIEIATIPSAQSPSINRHHNECAAAIEYENYVVRRFTLMAFGIGQSDPPETGFRLAEEAGKCPDE